MKELKELDSGAWFLLTVPFLIMLIACLWASCDKNDGFFDLKNITWFDFFGVTVTYLAYAFIVVDINIKNKKIIERLNKNDKKHNTSNTTNA